ncbi:helix-turn-helix domain-containing protein [Streptomyces sp. NPDC005017]|uniref:winged helix-turn-helix domain-containing protein n=1 Tax=Streptomyces sp. NPDC005017 TaxID=3364706 RepID=UPI0036C2A437
MRLPGCGGAGRPVGRKRLLQEVWGPSYGTETNCLRVYTARLRRKPEADPSHPKHFVTEPGTATASRSGGGAGPGEEGRVSDLPPGGATGLSVTPGTLQT